MSASNDEGNAVGDFRNLSVSDHPLIQHKLALLRDRSTPKNRFKNLVDELATLMAYEATAALELEDVQVETPLDMASCKKLKGKKLVLFPILRAGLGMLDGFLHVLPNARVGHIGLARDEETLRPSEYYLKVPDRPQDRDFLILDPMLATGGSASQAIRALERAGARHIRFVCLVAAPEGVTRLQEAHPAVPIHAAALDRALNEVGFIVPGLGDAGDRLFGTS